MDLTSSENLQLKSQKLTEKSKGSYLLKEKFNTNSKRENNWITENSDNQKLVTNPTIKQLEFELRRKTWVTLNHIRTSYGKSGYMLFK